MLADPPFDNSIRVGRSYQLRFAPDESSVAVIGRNAVLWTADRSKRIASAHPLPNPSSLDFSPAGDRLIVKGTSGECALLDARSLQELRHLRGKRWGEGASPVFYADGSEFIDASWNGDLLVRSAETGEVVHREADQGHINALVCSPDRTRFAYTTGREPVEVRVRPWPFDEHPAVTVLSLDSIVRALALDQHGHLAVIGGRPPALSIWSVESRRQLARREVGFSGSIDLAWAPASQLVLVEQGRAVCLTQDLQEVWDLDVPYACFAEFSASGTYLAIGSWKRGLVGRFASDQRRVAG